LIIKIDEKINSSENIPFKPIYDISPQEHGRNGLKNDNKNYQQRKLKLDI
jgi:hypothetical protein